MAGKIEDDLRVNLGLAWKENAALRAALGRVGRAFRDSAYQDYPALIADPLVVEAMKE